MTTDINIELFKRYAPKKKLEHISVLTNQELMAISTDTIKRIIKEAGRSIPHSRDKSLWIDHTIRTGNDWNSTILSWNLYKGKVYIDFGIEYANTDTTKSCLLENFLRLPNFQLSITREDRYGNPQTYYAKYGDADKCKAVRALLTQYVRSKYGEQIK